jgi:hypothetical protein
MSQTRVKRIIAKLNEKAANVMRQLMESDASKGRKVLTEKLEKSEATVATLQLERDGMKKQLEVEKLRISALELNVENLTAEIANVSNEALIGATARIDGLMEQLTSALEQKSMVEKQRDEVVKDLESAKLTIVGFGAQPELNVENLTAVTIVETGLAIHDLPAQEAEVEEKPLGYIAPPEGENRE